MSTRTGLPAGADGSDGLSLRLELNPLRLAWSAAPWRAARYLMGYLLVSWVLFSIVLTAVTTTAALAITLAGIPLLIATAGVVRGCAAVERARLRPVLTAPVSGRYQAVTTRHGLVAQATICWRDPATWRDVAYLLGLWAPLYALDTVVLSIWLTFLAGITVPLWYWAPELDNNGTAVHGVALGYFPNGPHGRGAAGLFVGSLPVALLAAAAFLVLFLLFNYILVVTARAQARVARALLRAPADPLAPARDVLSRPGPLGPLTSHAHNGFSGPVASSS